MARFLNNRVGNAGIDEFTASTSSKKKILTTPTFHNILFHGTVCHIKYLKLMKIDDKKFILHCLLWKIDSLVSLSINHTFLFFNGLCGILRSRN
jgi:hypothetical protein